MKNILNLLLCCVIGGCASPTVSYIDENSVNTLTTNFTMTDLTSVSTAMADKLIVSRKVNKCGSYTVSPVVNKTDQYIDTSSITQSIQDRLSNSKIVTADYVVAIDEMKNQTEELKRQNQSGYYAKSTTAKTGEMVGAECRIDGFINSITSTSPDGKTRRVDYQFNMKLINIKKGMGLWSAQKMISKQIQ